MSLTSRSKRTWILSVTATIIGAVGFLVLHRPAITPTLDLSSTDLQHTWRPIISIPWVTYGGDFGGVAGWRTSGVSSDSRIDQWFDQLQQDGVAAISWFLFGDGRGALAFDTSGYVKGLAPGFWADYHSVLAAAERHNLRVVWVVTDFTIGMPVQLERGVQEYGRSDLLEDSAKRRSLIKEALAPVLRDKTGSAQIAGWLVLNEPEHLLRSGYVTEAAVRAFVTEASAEIKRYHPEQRVGLANSDLASMIEFADLESLDFLVFHHYRATLPPPALFVRDYYQSRLKSRARSKPIFIGEFNWNFPPEADLDRFVRACRELGYAGAWPWSLRNRLNLTASTGTDTDPQFPLAGAYGRSMRQSRATASSDRKNVREWAITQLHTQLLPEVRQRIAALPGLAFSHKAEAGENDKWKIRCQNELAKAAEMMNAAQEQARHAKASIVENERWVSHALSPEVSKSRAALQKSRDWLDHIDEQLASIRANTDKQTRDLETAVQRARMHSYLAREASVELAWLEVLEPRLTDSKVLAAAVNITGEQ